MLRTLKSAVAFFPKLLLGLALPFLVVTPGRAWESYSNPATPRQGYCATCHGGFVGRGSLHDGPSGHVGIARTNFTNQCSLCHTNVDRKNTLIMWSAGNGSAGSQYGCTGCHGENHGETIRANYRGLAVLGKPKMSGFGLTKVHLNNGVTVCLDCHAAVPQSSILPESTNPPYYARADVFSKSSCNTDGREDNNGNGLGLDNDGDGQRDAADSDCAPAAVCGNGTLDSGEQCDDGNVLNGDCCSSTCRFEPQGSACSDRMFCTVGETCNGAGACTGGVPNTCSDPVACTTDTCNETTDICVHTPSNTACSDGQYCNGAETCTATGCQPGTPVNCSDGNTCTTDTCNETTDQCAHVYDSGVPGCTLCGNGTLDSGEQCDDGNVLNGDCCSSTCQSQVPGSACDDGSFCTTGETCSSRGVCSGGALLDCSDGVDCTTDACDGAARTCRHTANSLACDDDLFCNGEETCGPSGCRRGTPVNCDDGSACTVDSCNEAAGRCDHLLTPGGAPGCDPCPDQDADGYVNCTSANCDPSGLACGDCDDGAASTHPGAVEVCDNGADDDCDGAIDTLDSDCPACADADGDQYSPAGGSCGPIDCNDARASVHPGARESCNNGLDDDCDGFIDAADSECGMSTSAFVRRVLAPKLVVLRQGPCDPSDAGCQGGMEYKDQTRKVFVAVRNAGRAPATVGVRLQRNPGRGVEIVPVGPAAKTIPPGARMKFQFKVTFTREIFRREETEMAIHFTATATDSAALRSEPVSPEQDTMVRLCTDRGGCGR